MEDFIKKMKEEDQYYKEHYIQGYFRDSYHFLFWGIPRVINEWRYEVIYAWERVFKGFDRTAYWNLDSYITNIALPVLKWYRTNGSGYPVLEEVKDKSSEEQQQAWNDALDKMINAFQAMKNFDNCIDIENINYEEHNKIVSDGLHFFAKHFRGLWD